MPFIWKPRRERFTGEGIYHITLAVTNRAPLLGTLEATESSGPHTARTISTPLGREVSHLLESLGERFPGFQLLAKQLMPDHLHAVVYMHGKHAPSIKMVTRSFSQACSKAARSIAAASRPTAARPATFLPAQLNCANKNGANKNGTNKNTLTAPTAPATPIASAAPTTPPSYDCGNGANTLFSTPYIRCLSHKGQLRAMIDYVHSNPDRAWMRRQHRDLFTIRRRQQWAGLAFDMLGNPHLLEWPDNQVIALSRSITSEQIEAVKQEALYKGEDGAVTFTAAIAEGEKIIARTIREAGLPLVVMLLEGFPDENSEAARYFHPNGIYHHACAEGRLLLMAPLLTNYENVTIIAMTDNELQRKAAIKHQDYQPLPHSSARWRMIAGNIMLHMCAEAVMRKENG